MQAEQLQIHRSCDLFLCSWSVLAERAVDGSPGGTIVFRQLTETETALPITEDGITIKIERQASDASAFEPCTAHTGLDSLDDVLRGRSKPSQPHALPALHPCTPIVTCLIAARPHLTQAESGVKISS